MFESLVRYFYTLRDLKGVQIWYRLYYALTKRWPLNALLKKRLSVSTYPSAHALKMQDSIPAESRYLGDKTFLFLNIRHQFTGSIDWNYSGYGKLWTYNLTYFEFLDQASISPESGLQLINDFIKEEALLKDGLEPFPISLRTVYWIKFLAKHKIRNTTIDQFLFRQIQNLYNHLEYHLLGNHLLENAFGLLFGAYYFSDANLFRKAEQILRVQLEEQILADGAHFELSPMYHQLMLFRLMDSINLMTHNEAVCENQLLPILRQKASLMLGWLQQITFSNGTLPRLNDSIAGIAPDQQAILDYAKRLELPVLSRRLQESGYRMFRTNQYELVLDVGHIGPDYIPGHAHSDTFNFVLHHQAKPILVDTGISTYEKNELRRSERSTVAHNTVMIDELEQSEVWSGFRVARKAKIIDLQESDQVVEATHDGYNRIGVEHTRRFEMKTQEIEIFDRISKNRNATAFLHFHPSVAIDLKAETIFGAFGKIEFQGSEKITLASYSYAVGFNQTVPAIKAIIYFREQLSTKILLN